MTAPAGERVRRDPSLDRYLALSHATGAIASAPALAGGQVKPSGAQPDRLHEHALLIGEGRLPFHTNVGLIVACDESKRWHQYVIRKLSFRERIVEPDDSWCLSGSR
jgi:hypothetical protein